MASFWLKPVAISWKRVLPQGDGKGGKGRRDLDGGGSRALMMDRVARFCSGGTIPEKWAFLLIVGRET